jgi:hypothetical protein
MAPLVQPIAVVSEEITTVVHVSWKTPAAADARVEFGLTESYGMQTPVSTGLQHRVPLLGLRADETYHYRIVDAEGGALSEDQTVTTGSLPNALPAFQVTGDSASWSGYVPVPLLGSSNMVVILDSQGEIVWYQSPPEETAGERGGRRALIGQDGSGVFYNQIGERSEAGVMWSDWSGELQRYTDVPSHNHDFVELEDGELLVMRYERREVDGADVMGDRVSRVAVDGTITDVWSAFDEMEAPPNPGNGSWTHANALDLSDDGFYLGMREVSSIFHIREGEGITWGLGDSEEATVQVADAADAFEMQHQFEFFDDRLLVFDNNPSNVSRVMEYALSDSGEVEGVVWSYIPDPRLEVYALGDVQRMDDGATFINWSTAGRLELVSAEGELLWSLATELGYAFGYGTPVPTLYPQ